jgi:hypothetical protein
MQGCLELFPVESVIPILVELLKQLVQIRLPSMIAQAMTAAFRASIPCTLSRATSLTPTVSPFTTTPNATSTTLPHLLTHFRPLFFVQFSVTVCIELLQHFFPHSRPLLRSISPRSGLITTLEWPFFGLRLWISRLLLGSHGAHQQKKQHQHR